MFTTPIKEGGGAKEADYYSRTSDFFFKIDLTPE